MISSRAAWSVVAVLMLGALVATAAVAPLSPEELKKRAAIIVTGKVLSVKAKKERSRVERAVGVHRDRVFRITVKVEEVAKGAGVEPGKELVVMAWRPAVRIPPLPGPQGHSPIPEEGDRITAYLQLAGEGRLEPILPNGIVVLDE